MTTLIDYALMAGASYISTRSDKNQFPVPQGWTEQIAKRQSLPSGFEATYFTNGTDIVISFAGTYDSSARPPSLSTRLRLPKPPSSRHKR